jgi:hypothetical protein
MGLVGPQGLRNMPVFLRSGTESPDPGTDRINAFESQRDDTTKVLIDLESLPAANPDGYSSSGRRTRSVWGVVEQRQRRPSREPSANSD